jgi:hydrogenase expression/formation protein HypE
MTLVRAPRKVRDTRITLAHGSGGKAMRDLVAQGDRLAFTTDSYVVDPLVFAGGDIGRLAVAGTVNDLAVGGARPVFLSCAIIAEEGLDIALLRRVARSMQDTAAEAGVK